MISKSLPTLALPLLFGLYACGSGVTNQPPGTGTAAPAARTYSVTLNWTPAAGSITRYWVQQSADDDRLDKNWSVASIIPPSGTSVTILGYVPGVTYFVYLETQAPDPVWHYGFASTSVMSFQFPPGTANAQVNLGAAGNPYSLRSEPEAATPRAGDYPMQFRWRAPSPATGVTGYQVLQSTDAATWSVAAQVNATQNNVTTSGFAWNQVYYMTVVALSANGSGPIRVIYPMEYASDLIQGTIDLGQPLSPP